MHGDMRLVHVLLCIDKRYCNIIMHRRPGTCSMLRVTNLPKNCFRNRWITKNNTKKNKIKKNDYFFIAGPL